MLEMRYVYTLIYLFFFFALDTNYEREHRHSAPAHFIRKTSGTKPGGRRS